ncbi:putative molybdopterin binding domain protein, partial [Vibrio parahaemolyticus V-223/04]
VKSTTATVTALNHLSKTLVVKRLILALSLTAQKH